MQLAQVPVVLTSSVRETVNSYPHTPNIVLLLLVCSPSSSWAVLSVLYAWHGLGLQQTTRGHRMHV